MVTRSASRLCGFLVLAAAAAAWAPAWSGGLAVVETVLSDNGDGDGFADTRETVTLRLRVKNTTGATLTGVVLHLDTRDDQKVCIVEPLLAVGNLAAGETRLTDGGFVFVVADLDRTVGGFGPYDDLPIGFDLSVTATPSNPKAYPSRLRLDLDLDVSGGSSPTTFFESFESQTLGAFAVQNLDGLMFPRGGVGIPEPAYDGTRCQYNDPDNPLSNTYGSPSASDCWPGASLAQASAVFWGLSGPALSPLGGRAFSGFHSMVFGTDMGPPKNWTSPLAVLEAVATQQPIALSWGGASPVLSIKHQASLVDFRSINSPPLQSVDRGVVMVQVANAQGQPAGPWIKLEPYQNVYDEQAADAYINCMFDPIDDGNTEDDMFEGNSGQPHGPSSTCFPEHTYANIGETSNPFLATNLGLADGPGLAGVWGIGTWVESRFDLGRFRGRQVRLRFLVSGIKATPIIDWDEYFDFNPDPRDDGWWIDDVTVDGALAGPAAVASDAKDNSQLPSAPPYADPDSDAICGGDNCPATPNPDQLDGDADGWGSACDCAAADSTTHPGAAEVNDGIDNQCPGDEGFGSIDEVSGVAGFMDPLSKNVLSWPAQVGAVRYQVARASSATFTTGCSTLAPTPLTFITDAQAVAPGTVRFYLVRAFFPLKGSWGQTSAGAERVVPCAP